MPAPVRKRANVASFASSDPFWDMIGQDMGLVRAAGGRTARALQRIGVDVSQGEAESAVLDEAVEVFRSFSQKQGATIKSVLRFAVLRATRRLANLHGRQELREDMSDAEVAIGDELPDFSLNEFLDKLHAFDRWIIESRLAGATWLNIAQAVCRNENKIFFPSAGTKLKRRMIRRLCPMLMGFFDGPNQARLLNLLSGVVGDGHTVGNRKPLSQEDLGQVLAKLVDLHPFDRWVIDARLAGLSWAEISTRSDGGDEQALRYRFIGRLRKAFRASTEVPRRHAARLLDMVLR